MTDSIKREAIEHYVTCPVCKYTYDRDDHKPKFLICDNNTSTGKPTTHSLCIDCLQKLIKQCHEDHTRDTFRCPSCRHEHKPPSIEVDVDTHYITNNDILGLSDLLQNQSRRKENSQLKKCENCYTSNLGEAWCKDCSRVLCKDCRKAHDNLPLKQHSISIPLNAVDWQTVERKDFCLEHRGEVISKVCMCFANKLSFVCKVCAEDKHKGHDIKDLKAEVEASLGKVTKLYEKAVTRNSHDLDYKQQLEATTKTLASNLTSAELDLSLCQNHLMKMIKMHCELQRRKMHDIKENHTTLLSKELEQNKQRCSTFTNITNEFDTLHLSSLVQNLKKTNNLCDDLNDYLVVYAGNTPATNVFLEMQYFSNDRPMPKFEKILQETVQIKTMPHELKVYHPEVAFQGHEFKLIIQTFSESEKICRVGGLPVKVVVHSPCCDEVQETLYPLSTDEGGTSGQYVVPFVPESTGKHIFYVYIQDSGSDKCISNICVSVHQLEITFEKVVLSGQYWQIQARFRDEIDLNILRSLNVEYKDEVGDMLASVIEDVNSHELITRCQPKDLGKISMFITVNKNNFRIAGPFVTAVYEECKQQSIDSNLHEITDLISDANTSEFSLLTDTIDNANMSPAVSFVAFDKGTKFVLSCAVIQETITSEMMGKTELRCSFDACERIYILESVKNPAGFAISSSGEFAVSDTKEHRIFIFRTPNGTEDNTQNLLPIIRSFGEKGNRLGTFNKPTTLRINNSGDKLYVCDSGNGRVEEFNMNGELLNSFGPEVLKLNTPEAICLSPEGYLLILNKYTLVTIDVNSHSRRPVYQVDMCCNANIVVCNFNHLICCLSEGKVVHLCRKNNSLRIFKYRPMQEK